MKFLFIIIIFSPLIIKAQNEKEILVNNFVKDYIKLNPSVCPQSQSASKISDEDEEVKALFQKEKVFIDLKTLQNIEGKIRTVEYYKKWVLQRDISECNDSSSYTNLDVKTKISRLEKLKNEIKDSKCKIEIEEKIKKLSSVLDDYNDGEILFLSKLKIRYNIKELVKAEEYYAKIQYLNLRIHELNDKMFKK